MDGNRRNETCVLGGNLVLMLIFPSHDPGGTALGVLDENSAFNYVEANVG
jgi:hypothetical protein